MEILQQEKNNVFESLTEQLIKEANYKKIIVNGKEEEVVGWAREANISISSTLNTGEVLLGLLFSRNINVHGKLSSDVSRCIEGGIKFLLNNQCQTGGWTTSESDVSWAKGNLVSTALAIWAFSEYELIFDRDDNTITDKLKKAYEFLLSCSSGQDNDYRFRPDSKRKYIMASAYALLAYVNLKIYSLNVKNAKNAFENIDDRISEILSIFQENINSGEASFFEQVFCFISLKQIYKYDLVKDYKTADTLKDKIEDKIKNLTNKQIFTSYRDTRDVRENGSESDFYYFTQCWLLIALDYCKSTAAPYKKDLLKSISKTLFETRDNKISVEYQGRQWIWAIAQVLMALSIHSTTQKLDDFLGIGKDIDTNSIFLVYGRNLEFKESIENFLTALRLKIIPYDNSHADVKNTYYAVKKGINNSAVSIILLTGDDEGRCRKPYLISTDRGSIFERKRTKQPRLNVVFETGYSFAYREDRNVILITADNVRLFSDLDGINKIQIKTDKKGHIIEEYVPKFKRDLLNNLLNCGCVLPENAELILRGLNLPEYIK